MFLGTPAALAGVRPGRPPLRCAPALRAASLPVGLVPTPVAGRCETSGLVKE